MDAVLILAPLAVIACGVLAIALGGFRPAHIYSRRGGVIVALVGVALMPVVLLSLPTVGTRDLGTPRPVSSPRTVDPAAVAGNPYPQDALVRFANTCERSGSHALCVCMYGSLERHYSYERFQELVAADDSKAPEYTVVARDCSGQ